MTLDMMLRKSEQPNNYFYRLPNISYIGMALKLLFDYVLYIDIHKGLNK